MNFLSSIWFSLNAAIIAFKKTREASTALYKQGYHELEFFCAIGPIASITQLKSLVADQQRMMREAFGHSDLN
jgi:hypothetical protein